MSKRRFLFSKAKNRKGFTLVELLIVIAIIAVLTSIAIPVFGDVLENARNKTDVYNARLMARAVQYYLTLNPKESAEFEKRFGANPGGDRPYILVTNELVAICTDDTGVLSRALIEAGLIDKTPFRPNRYHGLYCKTNKSWKAYTVGFTYIDGKLVVAFTGTMNKNAIARPWTFWTNPDETQFRRMCTYSVD